MNFTPDSARRSGKIRLQFTSMIDVIFLLLIFFMATTTLSPPESQLPSALRARSESGGAADLEPQIVEAVRAQGRTVYRLGERVLFNKLELTTVLSRLPKEGGVFVKVADDVSVEWAAGALQACEDAGFDKVNYVSPQ